MHRYELVLEPTETWAVFDSHTGQPAVCEGRILAGLSRNKAQIGLAKLCADDAVLRLISLDPPPPTPVKPTDQH